MIVNHSGRRQDNEARNEARREIIAAANRHIKATGRTSRALAWRHIQQAVCICRQSLLVKPAVLEAAGYRVRRG